jgi:hypothetical protein
VSGLPYLNFDLLIERAEPDFRVRVLASPAGETRPVSFHVPFSDLEVENFLLKIGRPRRNVRRLSAPQLTAIKDFGGRLFEAVFPPDLRVNLAGSLIRADALDAGLRIRLRLSDCPELSELPWEYLYDREHNRFLSLSEGTPLVRYLEVSDPVRVLPVTPPLRILVVIASPPDFQQLDGEQEWRNVTASLSELVQRGRVEVVRLPEPTLKALQRQLRRDAYHVFHFIGHGGVDPHTEDGVLAMEDDRGRARLVGGEELGTLLHDHRSLRLAVLNSCEGARGDRTDPFSGTAQSLVQQGIPAVVAMQFEITDDAAITFSQVLYEAIADGYPLDAATVEARKAIYAEGNWTEWGTPVLYLRAPDGRIFDIQDRPPPVLPPSSSARPGRGKEEQAGQVQLAAAKQAEQEAAEQARREAAKQAEQEAAEQARREAAKQAEQEAAEQARRLRKEQRRRDTHQLLRSLSRPWVVVLAVSLVGIGGALLLLIHVLWTTPAGGTIMDQLPAELRASCEVSPISDTSATCSLPDRTVVFYRLFDTATDARDDVVNGYEPAPNGTPCPQSPPAANTSVVCGETGVARFSHTVKDPQRLYEVRWSPDTHPRLRGVMTTTNTNAQDWEELRSKWTRLAGMQ